MTALILQATPLVQTVAPTVRTIYRRFLHALDAFAEAKMRNAVPEEKLRKAQRQINHYRRLMHKSPANTARSGR
jgi:hypothetical protein